MVTTQGLYPVFSLTVMPLHHWTAARQTVERWDQQRVKEGYLKFPYVSNNQKSDEHGKFLEHALQLSGRKTIFLTTIIELNGHYIWTAIYNNRPPPYHVPVSKGKRSLHNFSTEHLDFYQDLSSLQILCLYKINKRTFLLCKRVWSPRY